VPPFFGVPLEADELVDADEAVGLPLGVPLPET